MRQLGGIDATFLYMETPETPMHVAGLTLYEPPEDFSGSFFDHFKTFFLSRMPRATNAWKLYEFTSGHKVDDRERHMGGAISEPPPVPTTAIYSRTDGICAWQNCVENDGPISESIEVEASHCGLGHHPAAVFAVADRLAQPEGKWKPFSRGGIRSLFFPKQQRG